MASIMRSTSPRKEPVEATHQESSTGNAGGNVQSYLITKYREALKKGDKSAAKSCLLAARYFSVNDPNVTNEIYIMAKSDGDVSEASKCFANIFNDLFLSPHQNSPIDATPELLSVINQVKEETRVLLGELKSHFIKLKSIPAPASLVSHHTAPSVQQSPMLSPRLRMSSEDRIAARESVSKLDSHLHSSTKSFFYQQMFDNLPEDVKKNILDHSIENCDNSFERCRLMMLTMTIFNDRVSMYGSRLLRSLMELSTHTLEKPDSPSKNTPNIMQASTKYQYAKSLLVLDAIPLVLNMTPLLSLDVKFDELFEKTLIFYSEHCLEKVAQEYEASDLHEGVKKAIATRILGTEMNLIPEESLNEDNLIATLNLISKKYLETVSDNSIKEKLQEFTDCLVTDKSNMTSSKLLVIEKIRSMNLEDDIPEDVLFATKREPSIAPPPPVVTPPPKGRGRPKKQQTPPSQPIQQSVAPNEERSQILQNKTREVQFAFFSIVQHMFINCASYLRRTRSRVMMNFNDPLADQIESDIVKSTSQRTSRSKTGFQQGESTSTNAKQALKKIKLSKTDAVHPTSDESPLNSEQSKMMDISILRALIEAQKSLQFLNSNYGAFTKLWQRFLNSNNTTELQWFKRITIDSMLISKQFDELSTLLESVVGEESDEDCDIKMEQSSNGLSTLTILPTPPSVSAVKLRALVQLISCHVQLCRRVETYSRLDDLITKMKQCGLMNNDDKNPTSDNLIEEYRTCFDHKDHEHTGFLFFDCWSMTRYCVDLLKEIMGTYAGFYSTQVHNVPDLAIGHAIVLSQFDWPKDFLLYDHCVTWIRRNKPTSTTPQCLSAATKFTYPEFLQHIRNPHILEDFMALLIRGYTLDVKGSSGTTSFMTSLNSQSRTRDSSQNSSSGSARSTNSSQTSKSGKAITTRGVNKTFKEDLKVALVTQMRNLSVSVSLDMISDFIQATLLPYLNTLKR